MEINITPKLSIRFLLAICIILVLLLARDIVQPPKACTHIPQIIQNDEEVIPDK